MKNDLIQVLESLREDHARTTGRPFDHFFCPIVHQDEDVKLCRGHVINEKFSNSDRQWVVQRKDVDSFLGSVFESDFVALEERGRHDPANVLAEGRLSCLLRPRFTVDGEIVDHFIPSGAVPPEYSEIAVQGTTQVRLGLKMHPNEFVAKASADWRFVIEKDLRLPALVSVLKSAHLTVFRLLGYNYALSAGRHFLGKTILGDFYLAQVGQARKQVIAAAEPHFLKFINIVRPALSVHESIGGTISDGHVFLCTTSSEATWAIGVFVRTGLFTHTVLVPVFEDPECAARCVRFLDDPASRFEVRFGVFENDAWEVSTKLTTVEWPRANYC